MFSKSRAFLFSFCSWSIFQEGPTREGRSGSDYVWFLPDDYKEFGGMTKQKLYELVKGNENSPRIQLGKQNGEWHILTFFSPPGICIGLLFMPDEGSLVKSFFFFFTII